MADACRDYLEAHHSDRVRDLARLVSIASISNDFQHEKELEQSVALTAELMAGAGLQNVQTFRSGGSNPYAYGEWLGAPGAPTVFLYAHHDVQPINFLEKWTTPPLELTAKDGRLYGRGSADDKGGIIAQLGAVAAFLKTDGRLPVNVKMLVEGEEEIGSPNLLGLFRERRELLMSDVIVVCDSENVEIGMPSITYSLRGNLSLLVEVETAENPAHSGSTGGGLADAALALNVILSRLYWKDGKLPIPHLYDSVRPLTDAERQSIARLPYDEAKLRRDYGVLPGVGLALERGTSWYEQTWRKPSVTVIAQEASAIASASNQVLPRASAIVSCRLVPDQDPAQVAESLRAFLTADPPWNAKVTVTPRDRPALWWITNPQGPAFEAALAAFRTGYQNEPIPIGTGGSIGFVGPLAELFGGAPALLFGIEDSQSNAHAPNESLHEGDWKKLMTSLTYFLENIAKIPGGKVK